MNEEKKKEYTSYCQQIKALADNIIFSIDKEGKIPYEEPVEIQNLVQKLMGIRM